MFGHVALEKPSEGHAGRVSKHGSDVHRHESEELTEEARV